MFGAIDREELAIAQLPISSWCKIIMEMLSQLANKEQGRPAPFYCSRLLQGVCAARINAFARR